MGACISSDILVINQISKPDQNQPKTTMDYSASSLPASKPLHTSFVITASPIGEKPSSIVTRPMPHDIASKYRLSSSKFRSFGSNEDVFFESQPWLESDGDDEFYSVNGDMTPSITSSASNTPAHRSLSPAILHPSNDFPKSYQLTLSPAKKRKSLSELFKEDEEENHENSNHDTSSSDEDTMKFNPNAEEPKSAISKPHFPQHTFTNSSLDVKVRKDVSHKPAQRCFPRLFQVHSPDMGKKNSIVAA